MKSGGNLPDSSAILESPIQCTNQPSEMEIESNSSVVEPLMVSHGRLFCCLIVYTLNFYFCIIFVFSA